MAHRVKTLAFESDDLSLIPRTCTVCVWGGGVGEPTPTSCPSTPKHVLQHPLKINQSLHVIFKLNKNVGGAFTVSKSAMFQMKHEPSFYFQRWGVNSVALCLLGKPPTLSPVAFFPPSFCPFPSLTKGLASSSGWPQPQFSDSRVCYTFVTPDLQY